jgi:hypothetical protein
MADLLPNAEVVVTEWVRGLSDITDNVGTKLPAKSGETYPWADSGFIRVANIFENINYYTGVREAIATLEVYWWTPNVVTPPYPKANNLAEQIVRATMPPFDKVHKGRVALPSRYYPVNILEATTSNGPRRDPRDEYDNRAVYLLDIRVVWVAVSNP